MWAGKGMGVVETVWEMKETHWGGAKAKQMAGPWLQVAKKAQQQAGQTGICVAERPRGGAGQQSPKAPA